MSNRAVRNIYSQMQTNQPPHQVHIAKDENKDAGKDLHKDPAQDAGKDQAEVLFTDIAAHISHLPTTEAVDFAIYKSRRLEKTRINGNVPLVWKQKLDCVADHLGVNKYDMVAYLIGKFLGEI